MDIGLLDDIKTGLSGNGICLQYVVVPLKESQHILRITYHFPTAPHKVFMKVSGLHSRMAMGTVERYVKQDAGFILFFRPQFQGVLENHLFLLGYCAFLLLEGCFYVCCPLFSRAIPCNHLVQLVFFNLFIAFQQFFMLPEQAWHLVHGVKSFLADGIRSFVYFLAYFAVYDIIGEDFQVRIKNSKQRMMLWIKDNAGFCRFDNPGMDASYVGKRSAAKLFEMAIRRGRFTCRL